MGFICLPFITGAGVGVLGFLGGETVWPMGVGKPVTVPGVLLLVHCGFLQQGFEASFSKKQCAGMLVYLVHLEKKKNNISFFLALKPALVFVCLFDGV